MATQCAIATAIHTSHVTAMVSRIRTACGAGGDSVVDRARCLFRAATYPHTVAAITNVAAAQRLAACVTTAARKISAPLTSMANAVRLHANTVRSA